MPVETALSLVDFTQPDLIVPRLSGRGTAAVIWELAVVLRRQARVPDLLPFFLAAINREFCLSTVLEQGLAFPHARVNGLTRLCFALGRSAEPLVWVPKGSPPARLVFLFAVPATDAATYVLLLARLARLAKDPRWLDQIHEARDASEILDVLKGS
jgi:mannitol/fructose-specific phosphotransferase system IIA component (Ntr-type)